MVHPSLEIIWRLIFPSSLTSAGRLVAVSVQFIADDGNGGRKREDHEANCHIDFRE
jgi:hypothetical protein